jgi:hypothetical protein
VRSILRAILSLALLFGSGVADWTPASTQAHESCCCGTPATTEDSCPCPKPEGNRTPSTNVCPTRAISVASLAVRRTQGERRTEPRPEPATWAQALDDREFFGSPAPKRGRDPELGRHLALLSTFRI